MQRGFFKDEELSTLQAPVAVAHCPCGLDRGCQSPKMPVTGNGERQVLIIAEAPGEQEDARGVQLIGPAGQVLRRALKDLGWDLDRDCWKTNAVCCRPPNNRPPSPMELEACRGRWQEAVEGLKPTVIIPLGGVATQSVLGTRWKKDLGGIGRWRGWAIPDLFDHACWICPTLHPSYILREGGLDTAAGVVFRQDLKGALSRENLAAPVPSTPNIHLLMDVGDVLRYLESLLSMPPPGPVAIDFETTGLKPHGEGHAVVCCAIAESTDCYVFPVQADQTEWTEQEKWDVSSALLAVMRSPLIKKIASNIKFEDTWTRFALGAVHGGDLADGAKCWAWDTMLAAHVLDNRPDICGLKFQAFVRYGITGYDDAVAPFLRSDNDRDANSFNRVQQAPLRELMTYCGWDAALEEQLARDQKQEITRAGLRDAYNLLHHGILALSRAEATGIVIDVDYCQAEADRLMGELDRLRVLVTNSEEGKTWQEMAGEKFSLESNPQLSQLLFKRLGLKPVKATAKGHPSVDEDTLRDINVPMVQALLKYRKTTKLRETYLLGVAREASGGLLHPNFSLHTVATYRSSSQHPNFQNLPIRDPEAGKVIRSAFRARPGRQLVEIDYGGIEVRVAACYHKDPVMLAYIHDPTKDLHRDLAMECYAVTAEQMTKQLRYCGKNCFVFPQFYGSYHTDCAKALWDEIKTRGLTLADKTPLREHLAAQGWKSLKQFEGHIQDVEEDFWGRRFSVYDRWRRDWYNAYLRQGYFDTLTGFRCSGVMRRNEVINYPVQGSAFHCLLWSLTALDRAIRDEKMDSRIVGQIHDSLVFDVEPTELLALTTLARYYMTKAIRTEWPWIIVPLEIEIEVAPVDGTWYEKKTWDECLDQ